MFFLTFVGFYAEPSFQFTMANTYFDVLSKKDFDSVKEEIGIYSTL